MPTPTKPIALIKAEGNKRHLSKKEMESREKAEKSLLTGSSFKEWDEVKNNIVAHKEFTRLKKLFKAIQKDDGLHESIINRYCLLLAESKEFENMKSIIIDEINELKQMYDDMRIDPLNYINEKGKLQDRIMKCDKKIMDKRKMMFDIEKENIMTIASVLRSIPKKVEEPKEIDPMAKLLGG